MDLKKWFISAATLKLEPGDLYVYMDSAEKTDQAITLREDTMFNGFLTSSLPMDDGHMATVVGFASGNSLAAEKFAACHRKAASGFRTIEGPFNV